MHLTMLEIVVLINYVKSTDNTKKFKIYFIYYLINLKNMFLGFGFVVIKYRYLKTKEKPASDSLIVMRMDSPIIRN